MITCKLIINKQKNICVGIIGIVLVFLVECCLEDKMIYSAWQSRDRRLSKNRRFFIAFLSSVCPVWCHDSLRLLLKFQAPCPCNGF